MRMYVGITDSEWFRFLKGRNANEMNFWRPLNRSAFNAIAPGELFLFKTKFPENKIVGGAFLVRHTTLPLELAWSTFGESNGTESLAALRAKISSLRRDSERNPTIGCTVLTQPFYFTEDQYLDSPRDWSPNIVTGKRYIATEGEGARLYTQIMERSKNGLVSAVEGNTSVLRESSARYGAGVLIRPRLGQGGFRVEVLDEYTRRCSMTGERTLPVLEAGHIRPYSEDGPHEVCNGLLLRSDLHILFDKGYITVGEGYRIEVSRRIREEFSNGRDYYALHGQPLKVFPANEANRPAQRYLEWHQSNCFLGA